MDIRAMVIVGVVALIAITVGVKWADGRRADQAALDRCAAMRADPSINENRGENAVKADMLWCAENAR